MNMIGEYILLGLLLISAAFLVAVVTIQKSGDEGLSGTIAGGSETYYGKDKSMRTGRLLNKWTLIVGIVFAIAVLAVYVIQPDYTTNVNTGNYWQDMSDYADIFK